MITTFTILSLFGLLWLLWSLVLWSFRSIAIQKHTRIAHHLIFDRRNELRLASTIGKVSEMLCKQAQFKCNTNVCCFYAVCVLQTIRHMPIFETEHKFSLIKSLPECKDSVHLVDFKGPYNYTANSWEQF